MRPASWTGLTGGSPAPVGTGAPGSRPRFVVERRRAKRGVRSLFGGSKCAGRSVIRRESCSLVTATMEEPSRSFTAKAQSLRRNASLTYTTSRDVAQPPINIDIAPPAGAAEHVGARVSGVSKHGVHRWVGRRHPDDLHTAADTPRGVAAGISTPARAAVPQVQPPQTCWELSILALVSRGRWDRALISTPSFRALMTSA